MHLRGPLFIAGSGPWRGRPYYVTSGRWGPDGRDFPSVHDPWSSIWRICQGFGVALVWAGLLVKHNPWQNGRASGIVLEGLEGKPLPEHTAEQGGSPFDGMEERETSLERSVLLQLSHYPSLGRDDRTVL